MRHGHAADAMERIALAAAERDGVGLLLPHGVEGDIAIHGIHIAGLIAGGGGGCRRAPAEEGVALAGGNGFAQLLRKTVGLELIGGRHIRDSIGRICVIADLVGLGGQFCVDRDIASDSGFSGKLRTCTVLLGVPAAESVALDHGGCRERCFGACRHALEGVLAVVAVVDYDIDRQLVHYDFDRLRSCHVRYGVAAIGCVDRRSVDGYALDRIALIRRDGKGVAAAVSHVGKGRASRLRRSADVRDLSRKVTGRHHNGEGLLGHRANNDLRWVGHIICHGKLVIKRDKWFPGRRISAFVTLYRHQIRLGRGRIANPNEQI